jgi:5'-nucleotidase
MKPKILITNDDGISFIGLKKLWEALADHADVTIIAPATNQTGAGLATTLLSPIQIEQVAWEKNTPAWKVTGTPVDCIKLALAVILKEKPDVIVSGINQGSNSGRTLLYSGTVGSIIEGSFQNVPGIAFSNENYHNPNYDASANYIFPIVKYALENPLPKGTILNVNIPQGDVIKGVKLARQGQSYWKDNPDERLHPDGFPYFWMGGRWGDHDESEDSDVALLQKGYITAVPAHVGELTDHNFLKARKEQFERLF